MTGVEPKVRYARSDDVHLAYSTFGDGPLDIVLIPGFVSAVDLTLEGSLGPFIERVSSFARVITFDKRGTGLSDRVGTLPNLDTRMDDLRAVMDAAGSERAHLAGISEGGPMSIVFAATFPERVHSLLLYGSFATFVRTDDHPWMPSIEDRERINEVGGELWGSGAVLSTFLPKSEVTPERREFAATFESRAASPGAMMALTRMNMQIDVRAILPSISVPTIVVHASGDRIIPVESGRYLADHIPGARLVEFDMANHLSLEPRWIDPWYDDYIELVTGIRPAGPVVDRVLSTVMFTDIVDSTRSASERGDAAWRQLLDQHDDITRRAVARFRGTIVKHTGDGVLARFDGPARAVSCGLATAQAVKTLGIDIRTGVHTGEIELRGDDVGGIAVHVGARIMALADGGEVLVTRTVRDLTAGSGLTFDERGTYELKGVPDEWQVYEARG